MNEPALLDGRSRCRSRYGATPAVDGALASRSRRGRCLGVIGESGAGKTQAFLAHDGPAAAAGARQRAARASTALDLLGAGARALRGRAWR